MTTIDMICMISLLPGVVIVWLVWQRRQRKAEQGEPKLHEVMKEGKAWMRLIGFAGLGVIALVGLGFWLIPGGAYLSMILLSLVGIGLLVGQWQEVQLARRMTREGLLVQADRINLEIIVRDEMEIHRLGARYAGTHTFTRDVGKFSTMAKGAKNNTLVLMIRYLPDQPHLFRIEDASYDKDHQTKPMKNETRHGKAKKPQGDYSVYTHGDRATFRAALDTVLADPGASFIVFSAPDKAFVQFATDPGGLMLDLPTQGLGTEKELAIQAFFSGQDTRSAIPGIINMDLGGTPADLDRAAEITERIFTEIHGHAPGFALEISVG